jgi:Na+-driven multidrug efflux pump
MIISCSTQPLATAAPPLYTEGYLRTLTEGSEARVIWSFAMPMLIGNVFQRLYNLTDA